LLNRILTIEIARVTEAAAIAAARWRGKGDERQADEAAVDAMRKALNAIIEMDGLVVIGEGERDQAAMLYVGEKVGGGKGPTIDIALDPLEGRTLCAKALPDAISCVAAAEGDGLLAVPVTYMDKIAIGGQYPEETADLDRPPEENIARLAKAKGVAPDQIGACILDRPRNEALIAAVRKTGASIRLISDGDIAGVIHTASPEQTGIDIYLGIGGAREGILAATALRCLGGHMQGRLVSGGGPRPAHAKPEKKLSLNDMASGDVMFAATGVTAGSLLSGVKFDRDSIETETVVMRSATKTTRWIRKRKRL
jgi:fructose-1,6-bisphosphatase II / sedoheptulose-1,7-bisphosphatase